MTEQEAIECETLIMAGRDMATTMLRGAVQTSENNEQLSNHVFVLRNAAIHILTMCAYNEMTQLGRNKHEALGTIFGEIEAELEMVASEPDNIHKEFPEPGTEIQ